MPKIRLLDEEADEFGQELVVESVEIKGDWVIGKKTDSLENNFRVIPKDMVGQIIESGDTLDNITFDE